MDDKRFDRIEQKLDRVQDAISRIDVTLVKQHESLVHHIKRTELLEQELVPISKHVHTLNAGLKLIGMLSAGVALAVAIKSLF